MTSRARRRIFLALALLAILVCGASAFVIARASSELVSPARRPLQAYHREWIEQPAAHGISIQKFAALDGRVPCLLVLPDARLGLSPRGEKLRRQLEERGVVLPAFGEMQANLVLMPGRNGNKEDLLPVAERFCAVGFRCILPDLPSHGESPVKICTFGASAFDAEVPAGVLEEAARRFRFSREPAGLWGMSMGGAYLARAASLPGADWRALVVVCSFDSLDAVLNRKLAAFTGPAAPVFDLAIRRACVMRGGVDPAAVRPAEWAASISAPLLMAHGTSDELIPEAFGRRLFEAYGSPEKRWVTVEGGSHDRVLVTDMPLYATMSEWFLAHLQKAGPLACQLTANTHTVVANTAFQISVSNVSQADVSLAAIGSGGQRLAPWKPTDTYSSPYILGTARFFPVVCGEAVRDSGEAFEIGHPSFRKLIQRAEWEPSDLVTIAPGESVRCDFPQVSPKPKNAVFHFLQFAEGKFTPLDVPWHNAEGP